MKNSTKTIQVLKNIARELNVILENDIRKFSSTREINNKNAAFLQLISA